MKRRILRNWLLRVVAGGVLYACLVGPAPGNVGGCGASSPVADAPMHCINQRFWECRRDLAGGRIDEQMYMDCLVPIQGSCNAASWPPGCQPTQSQSNQCIVLLSRLDLVSFTTPDLLATFPDCNLCL